MENAKFQKFIHLIQFDTKIVNLEKEIDDKEETIEDVLSQLNVVHNNFAHLRSEKDEAKKMFDAQELETKALQDKVTTLKVKIDAVHNNKEYQAVLKELESVQSDQEQAEQALMELWNKHESKESEYAVQHEAYEKQVQELEEQIDAIKQDMSALQDELTNMHNSRSAQVDGVPQDWMDLYEGMKGRVLNPVVPILQGMCSACFYLTTAKDLHALKTGELLQCRGCYRLLYYQEDAVSE